jgi:hypothetical protein
MDYCRVECCQQLPYPPPFGFFLYSYVGKVGGKLSSPAAGRRATTSDLPLVMTGVVAVQGKRRVGERLAFAPGTHASMANPIRSSRSPARRRGTRY